MVGGEGSTIDTLSPLFAAMGKKIFRMGDTGKGQATKLAMNLQIALIFEGFAEALTLATKLEWIRNNWFPDRSHDGQVGCGGIQGALCFAARLHS